MFTDLQTFKYIFSAKKELRIQLFFLFFTLINSCAPFQAALHPILISLLRLRCLIPSSWLYVLGMETECPLPFLFHFFTQI